MKTDSINLIPAVKKFKHKNEYKLCFLYAKRMKVEKRSFEKFWA